MDERMTLLADGRLLVVDRGPILEIRLHRPEVHNALDEELIAGLDEVFGEIARQVDGPARESAESPGRVPAGSAQGAQTAEIVPGTIRGIILSSEGRSFCAGADLEYMRRVAGYSTRENRSDAARLSAMFRAIRTCPVPVVGRVQGSALGGGAGLAACCDIVVAAESARFGFTEVRLGIVPAVISPFVLERIGPARARAFFPTGEIFRGPEALRIGLADRVVPDDDLDAAVDDVIETLLQAAPGASRAAKALVEMVASRLPLPLGVAEAVSAPAGTGRDGNEVGGSQEPGSAGSAGENDAAAGTDVFEKTAALIAEMRARPEAREGMAAFLEKRKPNWAP